MSFTYAAEIGRMPAEPYGAPDDVLGQERRRGAIAPRPGPTPGPPPPWGMQNVLCRFRCDTSAPNCPGLASPTSALRLAPSRYTCPPHSCTTAHTSRTFASYTPCVDGYVIISAARSAAWAFALAFRSSKSTLPSSSHFTTTTCMPAITALAALVPCADSGMRQTVRAASPRLAW